MSINSDAKLFLTGGISISHECKGAYKITALLCAITLGLRRFSGTLNTSSFPRYDNNLMMFFFSLNVRLRAPDAFSCIPQPGTSIGHWIIMAWNLRMNFALLRNKGRLFVHIS